MGEQCIREVAPQDWILPQDRGTLPIFFSCAVILSLCFWTATHLIIPDKNYPLLRSPAWQKLKWTALGMVAPELVVLIAWKENSIAKEIHPSLKYYRPLPGETSLCHKSNPSLIPVGDGFLQYY
ncbi:hypothetical protein K432DRAFT_387144, partial [Lepidopterella palustris CBS 459.81]